MNKQDDLKRLADQQEYLEQVKTACESDTSTLAAAGRPSASVIAIQQTADDLLNDYVLRYGVVGDANSGKSLLIGALVGKSDALPANPFPETGNITILHVRNDDSLDVTRVGPYFLNFLTKSQARECLKRLHEAVTTELGEFNQPGLIRDAKALLLVEGETLPVRKILDWIKNNWSELPVGLDLRNRLIELARFSSAWSLLGTLVADRQRFEVSREVAEAAMALPKDSMPENATNANAVIAAILAAGEMPAVTKWPNPPSQEFGFACYPLVRDIRVEVRVPIGIWDLRAQRVAGIEVFDFAGMGASKTSARDTLLVELERKADRIHAWILVVNASDLKGSQASILLRDLEPDRVIALANRFDGLPLAQEGYLGELKMMAVDGPSQFTQAQVVQRVRPLEMLTSILPELAPPERTTVVSALLGLAELDQDPKFLNRVITDAQRVNWASVIQSGQDARDAWGDLPPKIAPQTRDTTLVPWLTEYAKKGGQAGLVYLRRMLAKHANDQGVGLLAKERFGHIRGLDERIESFLGHLDHEIEESQQEAEAILTSLDELERKLREGTAISGKLEDLRISSMALRKYDLLPRDVLMHTAGVKRGRNICDVVHDEILMRVHDWPVWRSLLDSTNSEGFVEYMTPEPTLFGDEWDDTKPPMRAGELRELYCKSYLDVERIAIAHVKATLREALDRVAEGLKPVREALRVLPQGRSGDSLRKAFDVNGESIREILFAKLAPASADSASQNSFWLQRFPFLMPLNPDGGLTEGPFFGWAPERAKSSAVAAHGGDDATSRDRNTPEHQIYVFRLRYEICETIEAEILRDLAMGVQRFRKNFMEFLKLVNGTVNRFRQMPKGQLLDLFQVPGPDSTMTLPELQLRGLRPPVE